MNQGRIWCVVNPTVGLPLFLGSVALTSLVVHGAIMMNTTWYSAYYNGNAKDKSAMATPNAATAKTAAYSVTVTPSAERGTTPAAFTITVTPSLHATTAAATTLSVPAQPVPIKTASAG